jgi:hypothetical protein
MDAHDPIVKAEQFGLAQQILGKRSADIGQRAANPSDFASPARSAARSADADTPGPPRTAATTVTATTSAGAACGKAPRPAATSTPSRPTTSDSI